MTVLRLEGLDASQVDAALCFEPVVQLKIFPLSLHQLPILFAWLSRHRHTLKRVEFVKVDFGDHFPQLPTEDWLCELDQFGLNRCQIRPQHLRRILSTLQQANRISSLNLSLNPLGDEGARAIAQFLEQNTSLCELYVHRTNIGDLGAFHLFSSLLTHRQLKFLNIQDNRIELRGALALQGCVHLRKLILSNTRLGHYSQGVEALGWLLGNASSCLCSLDISQNALTVELIRPLVDALLNNNNTSLQKLLLATNNIGDVGAIEFARVLRKGNSQLSTLDLAQNQISEVGALELRRAVRGEGAPPHLYDLGLSGNRAISRSTLRGVELTIRLAGFFRRIFMLRAASESRRIGAGTAVRRLPRELYILVMGMLVPTQAMLEAERDEEDEEE